MQLQGHTPDQPMVPPSNGPDDKVKFKGRMEIVLRDRKGRIKQVVQKDNLIVTTGFQFIADSCFHQTSRPAIANYIAVGTTATAPAAGQTALLAQVARIVCTYGYAGQVATLQATFAAGTGTGALVEAGVFNASTSGIMLNRVTFSVVNKGASDSMTVTFTFTLS